MPQKINHEKSDSTQTSRMNMSNVENGSDFVKDIIDSIPGLFYLLDANAQFVMWNDYLRDSVMVKSEHEMTATSALQSIHPDDRLLVKEKILNIINNGVEDWVEVRAFRRGGPEFLWYLLRGKRVIIDHKPFLIGLGSDITERKKSESELQRLNRTLLALGKCNESILHACSEVDLLHTVCDIIVEIGGYRMVWVGYTAQGKAKSLRPVAQAGFDEGFLEKVIVSWADVDCGCGSTGTAIRTGKPSLVYDILNDPQFELWRMDAIKRGYASVQAFPLKVGNKVFGAVTVYSSYPDAFDSMETALLTVLADNLAYGITVLRSRKAQRLAEKNLRQSEKRYRHLFQNHHAVMLIIDFEDGRIIDANPAAATFYGWPIETLCRMHIQEINTLSPEEVKTEMENSYSSEQNHFSFRHRRANGSVRDVDVFSNKVEIAGKDCLYSIIYDVTDQKRYEMVIAFHHSLILMEATHSIEELLQRTIDEAALLTESSLGFFYFVTEDQMMLSKHVCTTITTKNMCPAKSDARYCSLNKAGICADAVREKRAVIHNDYEAVKDRKWISEGHAEVRREMVVPVLRDEKVVAILGVGNKLREYDADDVKWMELLANKLWDIVAKKIAEDEQEKMHDQLQKSMKMEMIGQLAAGIAHEIGNPLNYITLNEYNLQDDFEDLCELVGQYRCLIDKFIAGSAETEEVEQLRNKERELQIEQLLKSIPETLENSKNGIERITAITRSMRSYSFKNVLNSISALDLNKVIRETLVIAKQEYSTIATVALKLEELPPLFCDPSQINQVVLNLIINASHAIKLQNLKSPGLIEIKTWATAESIFFSITNEGPGITEEIQKRIFDPVFASKKHSKGTGLGLSISHDIIVKKYQGNLSVDSPPEGGTTFQFSLPIQIPPKLLLNSEDNALAISKSKV